MRQLILQQFTTIDGLLEKYVVSSTPVSAPWGKWPEATIIRNDPGAEIQKLKEQSGKDLVILGEHHPRDGSPEIRDHRRGSAASRPDCSRSRSAPL